MMKNRVFYTDAVLMIVFPLTLVSGLILHASGHGIVGYSKFWVAFHLLFGMLFGACCVVHVISHWNWYKGLFNGNKKRSRVTMLLSIAYVIVFMTGFVLMLLNGRNHHLGVFHYQVGIIFGVLGVLHVIRRLSVFKKMCANVKALNHRV